MTGEANLHPRDPYAIVEQTLSVTVLESRMLKIREAMSTVMVVDKHYGKIPGCPKPSLWQAGAELLGAMFQISSHCTAEDLSDGDHIRYRVTCEGRSVETGAVLGDSLGECSSAEEKYCWRKALCDAEFEAELPDRKREPWKKGKNNSVYQVKQVRTSPADLANTVLMMAEKRAFVHMIRRVTSCSDLFTQNLEDLQNEIDLGDDKPKMRAPKAKTETTKAAGPAVALISEPRRKRLFAITKEAEKRLGYDLTEEVKVKLLEHGFSSATEITVDKYKEICDWVESLNEGT